VFHAQMAEEKSAFAFADVVDAVVVKMKRRHPHVFAEAQILSAAEQTEAWENAKAAERAAQSAGQSAEASVLDGLPLALPALLRAVKLQKRLQRAGFDWPDRGGALAKLREELEELQAELEAPRISHEKIEDELGDLLFACANVSRFVDVDPEAALRRANAKVERRFRSVEARLAASGTTPEAAGLAEMDRLWDEVKRTERE
jgi:nucleoside triphosphate diphosphatase